MKIILILALSDFKLIFRDPSLRAFLFLPLILFALILWFLPNMVSRYDFLTPYLPIFLMVAVIENTQMFSFITSMVLIDEKEAEVARVYGIAPLSKLYFINARLLIPYSFTLLLNLTLLVIQPFFAVTVINCIIISTLAALIVPVYVLTINTLVKNRIQGMVYIKALNMLVLLPIAAFFVPQEFQHLFGILPTHWIYQGLLQVCKGMPHTFYSSVGFVFFAFLLTFATTGFVRKHFI